MHVTAKRVGGIPSNNGERLGESEGNNSTCIVVYFNPYLAEPGCTLPLQTV